MKESFVRSLWETKGQKKEGNLGKVAGEEKGSALLMSEL